MVQIGILPYAGVDIATFEVLKEWLLDHYDGAPPPYTILAAGMASSSIAQFSSYPLALTRTRLQVQISHLCHVKDVRAHQERSNMHAVGCIPSRQVVPLLFSDSVA